MNDTFRRIIHVLTPHKHSVYIWCPECLMMGINMPGESSCGNCLRKNCIEYYPCGIPDSKRKGKETARRYKPQ